MRIEIIDNREIIIEIEIDITRMKKIIKNTNIMKGCTLKIYKKIKSKTNNIKQKKITLHNKYKNNKLLELKRLNKPTNRLLKQEFRIIDHEISITNYYLYILFIFYLN